MAQQRFTKDITTGVGIISFPRVFRQTAGTNDKGETVYDCQFIIPKSQVEDCRAILRAIKEVGVAKWGDNWSKMKHPMRDGDKEKGDLCEDGETTKGEKYPERLGAFFLNVRSQRPVAIVGRDRAPIDNPDDIYAGCKVKINLSLYPYSQQGNHGIGAGLNGIQKIADGDAIGGGGKPSVESMFDMLEADDDIDLDAEVEAEVEETPPPAKKAAAKKAPAKKAAAKAPEPEPEEDDLSDLDGSDAEGEDDLFDDL